MRHYSYCLPLLLPALQPPIRRLFFYVIAMPYFLLMLRSGCFAAAITPLFFFSLMRYVYYCFADATLIFDTPHTLTLMLLCRMFTMFFAYK